MPCYEYECKKCYHKFMLVLPLKEFEKSKHAKCPKCGSPHVQKLIEPFFAVTAKKSGW